MSITTETVEHYAKLANLEFSNEETAGLVNQLGAILNYVDKLSELDLSDVPATASVLPNQPLVREDQVAESLGTERALANAPDQESSHFLVPKVITVKS